MRLAARDALNRASRTKKASLMENNEIFGVIQTRGAYRMFTSWENIHFNDDPAAASLFFLCVCFLTVAEYKKEVMNMLRCKSKIILYRIQPPGQI